MRDLSARVKRWRGGGDDRALDGDGAARSIGEKFRRIASHKGMPMLVRALRAYERIEREESVA